MQSPNNRHEYFPNLDGLRCVGALVILILHVENIKFREGIHNFWPIWYYELSGDHMVSLFFVLSGFLISYLLLKEKKDTSTINLKGFYVRRMLRIWPLYYLFGIIGFFIFPHISSHLHGNYPFLVRGHTLFQFLLYVLFISPFKVSDVIGPAWSVRVEEAFYLMWPAVIKKNLNFIKVCVVVIIATILVRNLATYFYQEDPIILFRRIDKVCSGYRLSCMAMGGLAAYIYISGKQQLITVLYRKDLQWLVYAIIAILFAFRVHIPIINFEFYAFFFAIAVLNLATNPESVIRLDYKWTNYLGKISYGIYLYNSIMRIMCLELVIRIFGNNITGLAANLVLYGGTIASTILVSALSFHFFEKPCLKLKKYFSV